jgi:hypothetical protein
MKISLKEQGSVAGDLVQVVVNLPNMCETLGSVPSHRRDKEYEQCSGSPDNDER